MRSITEIVKQFKQNWTEELSSPRIEIACRDCGLHWIGSMLNPITTVQIFLLQILNGNTACTDLPHLTKMVFTAAGYCKARMRIKLEVFQLLLQRCVSALHQQGLAIPNPGLGSFNYQYSARQIIDAFMGTSKKAIEQSLDGFCNISLLDCY